MDAGRECFRDWLFSTDGGRRLADDVLDGRLTRWEVREVLEDFGIAWTLENRNWLRGLLRNLCGEHGPTVRRIDVW